MGVSWFVCLLLAFQQYIERTFSENKATFIALLTETICPCLLLQIWRPIISYMQTQLCALFLVRVFLQRSRIAAKNKTVNDGIKQNDKTGVTEKRFICPW